MFEVEDVKSFRKNAYIYVFKLRTEHDNKTIGLLICRTKDQVVAQYALESSNQPIAISEYELEKFYPAKIEGTIPTIKEIENRITRELS